MQSRRQTLNSKATQTDLSLMVKVFCSSRACTMDVRKTWSWISLDKAWQHSSSWTFTVSWTQVRYNNIVTYRVTNTTQTTSAAGVKHYLTNVFDTWCQQSFTLGNKKGPLLIWQWLWCQISVFLCRFTLPQEKIFWRQSACSQGKESSRRFPSGQLSLSADPQNLWGTVDWGCLCVTKPHLSWLKKT